MNRKNILITGGAVLSVIGICTAVWKLSVIRKMLKNIQVCAVGYSHYLDMDNFVQRIEYLNRSYNFKEDKDRICILSKTSKEIRKIATYIYYKNPFLLSLRGIVKSVKGSIGEVNNQTDKILSLFEYLFFTVAKSSLTLIVYLKKEKKILDLHVIFFDKVGDQILGLLKGRKMTMVNSESFMSCK